MSSVNSLKKRLKRLPYDVALATVDQLEERARCVLGDRLDDVGDYAPLTWEQLVEMDESRLITIGSHSVTHPILTQCSPVQVRHELRLSKTKIEDTLRRTCTQFCYPNGTFDDATKLAVQRAGYSSATCSERGLNEGDADLFALRRVGVSGGFPIHEFAARVSGGDAVLARMGSLVRGRRMTDRPRERAGPDAPSRRD
jgi:hypothetical protein